MSNFPDPKKLSIDAFRYDLPEDRIAIKPLDRRDQSKLLVYRQGQITDSHFDQADSYLESGDLLKNVNGMLWLAMQNDGKNPFFEKILNTILVLLNCVLSKEKTTMGILSFAFFGMQISHSQK